MPRGSSSTPISIVWGHKSWGLLERCIQRHWVTFPRRMCLLFESEVTASKVLLFQQKNEADHILFCFFSFSSFPKLGENSVLITSCLLKSAHVFSGAGGWLATPWPCPVFSLRAGLSLSRTEWDLDLRRKDKDPQAATLKSQGFV